MLNVQITSRFFSNGFEISTPSGVFSAGTGFLAPTEECLLFDQSGNQIARLGLESPLKSVYNIIISGGGFYQFDRDRTTRRTWVCKGEGKHFSLSKRSKRQYVISDGLQEIAEGKKAWYTRDYAIRIPEAGDLKLVICIFIALSLFEGGTSFTPM